MNITTNTFANWHGYSDVYPYEVVRVISNKTLEVRAMETSENKTKLQFVAGGFSAHCTNNYAQDYDYSSNPENPVFRIRASKAGDWKDKHGRRFVISDVPSKFHDYNF